MTAGKRNLFLTFSDAAGRYASKTALADPTGDLSFSALFQWARRISELTQRKSGRERIGVYLPTSAAFAAAFYGIVSAGRTAVPLNLLVSRETLGFCVTDAEIDLIYTISALRDRVDGLAPGIICMDAVGANRESNPDSDATLAVNPRVPAVLLYTSGTTANPKGVPLSHRNILANLEGFEAAFDFGPQDVFLAVLPMFHTFALTTTLILPMSIGATVVCLPAFNPGTALELIESRRATVVMSIASMYRLLLHANRKQPRDCSTVRYWVAGGEALPQELAREFHERFNATLLEGYGLTETSPVVCVNRPKSNRFGTAGLPLHNVEVRIVDENGQNPPCGREGELWVRGENVMAGYFKRPADTQEALTPDGWLRTGDIAMIDRDGYVTICGRRKELLKISGESVSPVEIESVLCSFPGVFEAGVIPVSDPRRGETPGAFVSLVEGAQVAEEDLKAHCRKHLPPYKTPRFIRILPQLPHGPTGKVLRRALKDLVKEGG